LSTATVSSWNDLAHEISEWRESKGFVCPNTIEGEGGNQMLGKLMLVVSEISEMHEEKDRDAFGIELADAVIRILDILGTCGCDVERCLHENPYERERPWSARDHESMLAVNAVSRAAEAVRIGDFPSFAGNLAHCVNILCKLGAFYNIDVFERIDAKMTVNRARPYLHGKKTTL
jgi:hypothetical protein